MTMSLAVLLLISGTVQAGIKLVPTGTQVGGDPQIEWSFDVYLTPGSSLSALSSFTLTVGPILGLDGQAAPVKINVSDVSIISPPHLLPSPVGVWLWDSQTFGYGSQSSGYPTPYATTTVPFLFIGTYPVAVPTGSGPGLLLGDISLTGQYSGPTTLPPTLQLDYTSSLDVTAQGQLIPESASSPVTAGPGFMVIPEPSSLVIVALVGSSLMGVGLLRRRRRMAVS